jgi:hypothetical protein
LEWDLKVYERAICGFVTSASNQHIAIYFLIVSSTIA